MLLKDKNGVLGTDNRKTIENDETYSALTKLNRLLDKNEECLGLFYLGVYDKINNRNIKRKNINDDIIWHN